MFVRRVLLVRISRTDSGAVFSVVVCDFHYEIPTTKLLLVQGFRFFWNGNPIVRTGRGRNKGLGLLWGDGKARQFEFFFLLLVSEF